MKKSTLLSVGILAFTALQVSAHTVALSASVVSRAVKSVDFSSLPRPTGDVDKKLHTLGDDTPLLQQARRASAKGYRVAGNLTASVSVEGMGESQAYFEENFNTGAIPAGWEIAPTSEVTWTVSKPSGPKEFAEDPADGGSLVQDTPYQTFKREKSWAVSPEFAVGPNALLEVWMGFSLNYEDCCSMTIQVSDDNFYTFTDLWFSRGQTGEKPWQWRKVQASMAAFAGKRVKLRFFYGAGSGDMFDTGGYSGDYRIDNIRVSGPGTVESVELTTGERVRFVADTDADVESYMWSFPGGVPSTSTEATPEVYYTADGEYDVTLTVTRGEETATATRVGFVKVTGTEPSAAIGYPATFRHYEQGRIPLVAPMVPVTFRDASGGFPDSWSWEFAGTDADNTVLTTADTPEATVAYSYLHEHPVALTVANTHGASSAYGSVVAEYEGNVTNLRPGELGTVFDLEGTGTFPGSNTMKITAYAEKFSAPSRPMRVYGAYVFFTKVLASSVYYQLQTITVRLCKADENGLPGEQLDFGFWDVFELETGDGTGGAVGTPFEFTDCPVVDSDFFIVVEGIPELVDNADEQCDVRMAMAPFRPEGNTAYMLKDGKWVDAAGYFPAPANHTSYMILVNMAHSVISNLPGTDSEFTVNQNAGELTLQLFSYMGWDKEKSTCSEPWLHIASEPGEMTVDEVKVTYDALPGTSPRSGEITLTDGITSHTFTVTQEYQSALTAAAATSGSIVYDGPAATLTAPGSVTVCNAMGAEVAHSVNGSLYVGHLAPGVYVARSGSDTLKFMR